jgi:hypothetical protein
MYAQSCLIAVFLRACRFVLISFCIHESCAHFFFFGVLSLSVCGGYILISFPLPGSFFNEK